MNIQEPILHQDYPDPDVIRVGDTFYMISTTMHFLPGGVILRSYDLLHWEIASYIYETLDSTPGQKLEDGTGIYGKGMWAATLRFYKGTFYVVFVCNDTHKTYLYRAEQIEGPWRKSEIEGFYHDCSLLLEEDPEDGSDHAYLVYGNTQIYLVELNHDLTKPKEGGLRRLLVDDSGNQMLGFEGSHFYKIDGIYYLFLIHSRSDRWLRTEAVFHADSLEGEFIGGDVFAYEQGYRGSGIAQGGIVDDLKGNYYGIWFQDRGASGRMAYVIPVKLNQGEVKVEPDGVPPFDSRPDYGYAPIFVSDFLDGEGRLNLPWQWNHEPDLSLVDFGKDSMRVRTDRTVSYITEAKNILTQRTTEYRSSLFVFLDGNGMKDGDRAGLSAFLGAYAYIALEKNGNDFYLIYCGKDIEKSGDNIWKSCAPEEEWERILLNGDKIELKVEVEYSRSGSRDQDFATFYYRNDRRKEIGGKQGEWQAFPRKHRLGFRLDHFCGCRFGLFFYAKKNPGGEVVFRAPRYELIPIKPSAENAD